MTSRTESGHTIIERDISGAKLKELIDCPHSWGSLVNVKPWKQGDQVLGVQLDLKKGPDNPLTILGFKDKDVWLEMNGHPVRTGDDLTWCYGGFRSQGPCEFLVLRGGKQILLRILIH